MCHTEFPKVSLREFDLITKAKRKALDAEFSAQRVLNQELAKLVSYAFHKPDKMPDFTRLARSRKPDPVGGAEKLRAYFIGLTQMNRKGA